MTDGFVRVADADTLGRRIGELADSIIEDHPSGDMVVVAVLKGSLFFVKDLMSHLPLDTTPEFLALTRFGEQGRVSVTLDVGTSLENRDVVLALEIVDTGLTLTTILRMLEAKGARSIRTVALFDKVPRRIVDVEVDYRGFEVGDEYLLGYGLDWNGLYRNLPDVWAVMDMSDLIEDPNRFIAAAYDVSANGPE